MSHISFVSKMNVHAKIFTCLAMIVMSHIIHLGNRVGICSQAGWLQRPCSIPRSQSFSEPVPLAYELHKCFSVLFCVVWFSLLSVGQDG